MEEESRQLTEYLATKTDEVNTQRAEHDKLLEELKQSRYEVSVHVRSIIGKCAINRQRDYVSKHTTHMSYHAQLQAQ